MSGKVSIQDWMIWWSAPKFNRRAAALLKRGSSSKSDTTHGAHPGRKCPTADNAGRNREMLALRSGEERTVGGAEHRGFGADVIVREVDVSPLVDRQQCGRHGDINILPLPCLLAAVESSEDRNHRLQSRVDVGVRKAIGARLRQCIAIMTNAVFGEAGFGLNGRRIGHAAAPRTTLPVARDRRIDQSRDCALPAFHSQDRRSQAFPPGNFRQ